MQMQTTNHVKCEQYVGCYPKRIYGDYAGRVPCKGCGHSIVHYN